jgi:hypothetical protein
LKSLFLLGQPSRTGPRRGDFSAYPITQPHAVKTVTIMNNAFDCLEVHSGMPSDLDERIAAQPSQEVSHGIIGGKLFAYGMDPGAPFPSQRRYDLTNGDGLRMTVSPASNAESAFPNESITGKFQSYFASIASDLTQGNDQ